MYQAGVSKVAPAWIKPASAPVGIFGINMSQDSGDRLVRLSVNFTDIGGDGNFTASDLAPLSTDSSSGVAVYIDNKTDGTYGVFDSADLPAPLSSVPSWVVNGSTVRTSLSLNSISIPTNDLGNNSGPDFFLAIRTSRTAADGDDFSVSLDSGDIRTDSGPVYFQAVTTDAIKVDAVSPRAEAGPDITADEGVPTSFSGAASSDNIGIANYTWLFGDFGPLSLEYDVYVTHTFNSPGKFLVVLNVTDYAGNSDESVALVTVRNVNSPPVINSVPPIKAQQGSMYFYLIQASDADGDAIRFVRLDGPANLTVNATSGLVTWTPGPADVGSRKVTVGVTDDRSPFVTQTFTLEVQNLNDPPYFVSLPVQTAVQNQPYNYKAEARDPDNDQLVFTLVAGPRGITLASYTGLLSWVPAWDQVGNNRVVLEVHDASFKVYQDFNITVTNANDPPVILSVPPTSALQGVLYSYQVNAADPDGDEMRFFLNPAPGGMRITPPTSGLISWVPSPEQVGANFVRLEVTDGRGGASNQSFTITVANVNDPPVIITTPPSMARQGALYSYLIQAPDPDGDVVNYSLLSGPPEMAVNNISGLLEWLPGQSSVGRVSVVVLASDGLGGIAVQTFQLQVLDTNDPPVLLGDIEPVAFQGQPYITQVRAEDPDGDELTYSLLTQLDEMTLDRHSGVLVWYPRPPLEGEFHIQVRITDENSSSIEPIFNITVRAIPEPPRVLPIGLLHARVGHRFSYRVQVEGRMRQDLTFSSASKLFRINATTGEMAFTPGPGDVGSHEFAVEVWTADGLGVNASGVIEVAAASGSSSLQKVAGYGLAGLGGFNPWLILLISLAMGAVLLYQYSRLLRRDEEELGKDGEAKPAPPSRPQSREAPGVTEEERKALEKKRREDDERKTLQERESKARASGAPEDPSKKAALERKAKEFDLALEKQRRERELRENEENERKRRGQKERERLERDSGSDMERKAAELREREERERRQVLEHLEKERKVLSREEAARLEREIDEELSAAGLGGQKAEAPRKVLSERERAALEREVEMELSRAGLGDGRGDSGGPADGPGAKRRKTVKAAKKGG